MNYNRNSAVLKCSTVVSTEFCYGTGPKFNSNLNYAEMTQFKKCTMSAKLIPSFFL